MARKEWTKREIDYLASNIGFKKWSTIAKKLDRSLSSIKMKAYRENLANSKLNKGTPTATELAETLNVDTKTVIYWINHFELPATKRIAREKRKFWFIDVEEFWEWAEQNKERIDFSKIERNVLIPEPEWLEEEIRNPSKFLWTPLKETELIRLMSLKRTHKEISEELGITLNQIRNKLQSLRAQGRLAKTIRLHWSEKEMNLFYTLEKQGFDDDYIAHELGRDRKQVVDKRYQLKRKGLYEGCR